MFCAFCWLHLIDQKSFKHRWIIGFRECIPSKKNKKWRLESDTDNETTVQARECPDFFIEKQINTEALILWVVWTNFITSKLMELVC